VRSTVPIHKALDRHSSNQQVEQANILDVKPTKEEIKRLPKAFVPIKFDFEDVVPEKPVLEVKTDIKPVLEDEDEFTFDFDLDELAGMDDDLLLKPHVSSKVC
jgi:hypothetical protein